MLQAVFESADMLNAALHYSDAGWPVFPCRPDSKAPCPMKPGPDGRSGFYRATMDPAQITEWWTQWPNALIGVPTGPATGTFVVDCDVKSGATIEQLLERLLEIAELPSCPMTHTQSGGLHLWFRYPDEGELRNRRNMLPGIDVRGRGGYVIVAPSIMANGNPYRWARGNETSPMPQAPIELLETIMGTS